MQKLMSLILSNGLPEGIEVKVRGFERDSRGQQMVNFGAFMIPAIQIPMDDFCVVIEYVLKNTDIDPTDPRIKLIERIKKLKLIPGHNLDQDKNCQRIGTEEEAVAEAVHRVSKN